MSPYRALLSFGLCISLFGVVDAQQGKTPKTIRQGAQLAAAIQNEVDPDRRVRLEAMVERLSKSEKEAFVGWATNRRLKKTGWTKLARSLVHIGTSRAVAELGETARSAGNELGSGRALQALGSCRPRYAVSELLKGATSDDASIRSPHEYVLRTFLSSKANGSYSQRLDLLIKAMDRLREDDTAQALQPTLTEGVLISLASRMVLDAPDPSLLDAIAPDAPKPLAVAIAMNAPKRLLERTPRELPSRLNPTGRVAHRRILRPKREIDEDDPRAVAKRDHDEAHEQERADRSAETEEGDEGLTIEALDDDFWSSTPERSQMRILLEHERTELRLTFRALVARDEMMVTLAVFRVLPTIEPTLDQDWADTLMASLDAPTPIRVRDAALRALRTMTGERKIPRSQLAWKRWWKAKGKNATQ